MYRVTIKIITIVVIGTLLQMCAHNHQGQPEVQLLTHRLQQEQPKTLGYPSIKENKAVGHCSVHFVKYQVGKSGKIIDPVVFASSHKELNPMTLAAIKTWNYKANQDRNPSEGHYALFSYPKKGQAKIVLVGSEYAEPFYDAYLRHKENPKRQEFRSKKEAGSFRRSVEHYKTSPFYPIRLRQMGVSGHVIATFEVNQQGKAENIELLLSYPPERFDKSVIDALKRWEFSPKSAGTVSTIHFPFMLKGEDSCF